MADFTITPNDVRIDKNGNIRMKKAKANELWQFIEQLQQPPVGEEAAGGVQPVVKVML